MSSSVSPLCQAPDSKREQFRRYLEKAGVVDSLTKGKRFGFLQLVSCSFQKTYCAVESK